MLHFQVVGDNLTLRKFSPPLKNFQNAHKPNIMGITDHGGIITSRITVHTVIPAVLTRKPENIARISIGSLSQFFKSLFVPGFFFILIV